VAGLVPGQTYTLNVSAVYNLVSGNGSPEVITIGPLAGQQACTITMAPHPSVSLRAIDQCPNSRKLNYQVSNEPWVCSAEYFEYKFTQVLPTPGLSFYKTSTQLYSRNLTLSTVPGLVLGATYNVEIRPIFLGGFAGEWSSTPSCLKMIGLVPLSELEMEGLEETGFEIANMTDEESTPEPLLYPNPTHGWEVNMVLPGYAGNALVKFVDLSGKVVLQKQVAISDNEVINFQLYGMATGLYQVLINLDGKVIQRKLVVAN
jgi:hypothetical protein